MVCHRLLLVLSTSPSLNRPKIVQLVLVWTSSWWASSNDLIVFKLQHNLALSKAPPLLWIAAYSVIPVTIVSLLVGSARLWSQTCCPGSWREAPSGTNSSYQFLFWNASRRWVCYEIVLSPPVTPAHLVFSMWCWLFSIFVLLLLVNELGCASQCNGYGMLQIPCLNYFTQTKRVKR